MDEKAKKGKRQVNMSAKSDSKSVSQSDRLGKSPKSPKSPGSPKPSNPRKPWGGRFSGGTHHAIEAFTESVSYDHRLAEQDIRASIAHAKGLRRAGILSKAELEKIEKGLKRIREEVRRGEVEWLPELEDVHMNIEANLVQKIGTVGKKLHTGRSRNDQIATDERLVLLGRTVNLLTAIHRLQAATVDIAAKNIDVVMPGFTHLQIAQPVSFGHHMLAWFEMLKRDEGRINDARKRINVMPLGAAALAGTAYPIDRHYVARLLGFDKICDNSMDAVSDKDFIVEVNACCAMIMMHLSRFAEELVLWTSQPFGFVSLPDSCCTGSSIMPQKKNPDAAELIRGKTGRVYGDLVAVLTLMKGQPLTYNRDNQEDKEPMFDALDTTGRCLEIMAIMVEAMTVDAECMRRFAEAGYSTATEFADYLTKRGVPFRDAHEMTGRLVRLATERGCALDQLSDAEIKRICPRADQQAREVLSLDAALRSKNCHGGTAPAQVRKRIRSARAYLRHRQ